MEGCKGPLTNYKIIEYGDDDNDEYDDSSSVNENVSYTFFLSPYTTVFYLFTLLLVFFIFHFMNKTITCFYI